MDMKDMMVEYVHLNRSEFLPNGSVTERVRPGDGIEVDFENDLIIVTDKNTPGRVVLFPVTAASAIGLMKQQSSGEPERLSPPEMPKFSDRSNSRPAPNQRQVR